MMYVEWTGLLYRREALLNMGILCICLSYDLGDLYH